jgi:6,7-dimethyl-8-ribityllumazine synthase
MEEHPHLLIVEARFYDDISDQLADGAIKEITGRDASYDRMTVPGALEIPAAIRFAVRAMDIVGGRRRFDGYVALGCVIRGETSHYDIVAGESARGLMDLSLTFSLAIGNGILTCDTREQALERAAVDRKNKGGFAAGAALDLIEIKRGMGLFPR